MSDPPVVISAEKWKECQRLAVQFTQELRALHTRREQEWENTVKEKEVAVGEAQILVEQLQQAQESQELQENKFMQRKQELLSQLESQKEVCTQHERELQIQLELREKACTRREQELENTVKEKEVAVNKAQILIKKLQQAQESQKEIIKKIKLQEKECMQRAQDLQSQLVLKNKRGKKLKQLFDTFKSTVKAKEKEIQALEATLGQYQKEQDTLQKILSEKDNIIDSLRLDIEKIQDTTVAQLTTQNIHLTEERNTLYGELQYLSEKPNDTERIRNAKETLKKFK